MKFFNWFNNKTNRERRLQLRREKLGEKFTSDLTWRKYTTKQLIKLNPNIDFENVESIYEIGWCNGEDEYFSKLKEYISNKELSEIETLNNTIQEDKDAMSYIPIGSYLKTYYWTLKIERNFIQIIKGSFDIGKDKIKLQQEVQYFDITTCSKRKLIYPI